MQNGKCEREDCTIDGKLHSKLIFTCNLLAFHSQLKLFKFDF